MSKKKKAGKKSVFSPKKLMKNSEAGIIDNAGLENIAQCSEFQDIITPTVIRATDRILLGNYAKGRLPIPSLETGELDEELSKFTSTVLAIHFPPNKLKDIYLNSIGISKKGNIRIMYTFHSDEKSMKPYPSYYLGNTTILIKKNEVRVVVYESAESDSSQWHIYKMKKG